MPSTIALPIAERKALRSLSLALPTLAAFLLLACGGKSRPPAAPLQVGVLPTVQMDVPLTHEWVGTLDGFVNAEIRPQVEGYLLRQIYREGSALHKGDVLFEIDARQLAAAAVQTKAALARDQATLDKTSLDVARFAPLVAERAISQQELDNARASLRQAQANVDASKAAHDRAQLSLQWTRVTSPIDGIAGIAKVQVGDLVNPQKVMTTVSTVDPIKVYFSANEQEYMGWARQWATKGGGKGTLTLVLSDGTTYPFRGDPFMADRNVDLKTGTIMLAGLFPNPERLLRPGQFAKVTADVGLRKGALLVPQRAVWEVQGNSQVAVVGADNKVDIRPIQTGPRLGSQVVVEKGLSLGDKVVVEGTQKVSAGQVVKPVPATPPATAPGR
ncbi:MAG: efflux RND transporter periplasmic adaptor subunit [Holophagaceae bacterium]|nr:efflux RND transporter periplasmic adaptor subunit [Holophagaceae bacterium]